MNQTIEKTTLSNLVFNEDYCRKVLPFIKPEYFDIKEERVVFEEIINFVDKYKKMPTKTSLEIEIEHRKDLTEVEHDKVVELIQSLNSDEVDFDWLVDTTEKFCKDKAIYNAVVEGISIIDGKDKKRSPDAIPSILTDALAVSFDNAVGHDYFDDSDKRFEYYHKIEERIPFDLDFFNKITKLMNKTNGKLIVKEYPTASAHSNHFRGLIKELAIKRTFKPDIIFIDYLNICASSRFKGATNVNSYSYIKSVAEELRGLAVECNVPIMSATQTTRGGYTSSDIGLEDTSESFGLPATADFMFALISNEEMEELGQILVKQLKNRYNDPTVNKRFVVGIDRAKMKLYDVEIKEQDDLVDNGQEPVFDKTSFGVKFKDNKYDDFKV